MNNFSKKRHLILMALVVLLSFFVGWQVGLGKQEIDKVSGVENKHSPADVNADFSLFWKVWNVIEDKYVATGGPKEYPSAEEKVWGAIQGLAESLGDPYTVFLPPEEAGRFEEDISGNFEGVGMEVGMRDGALTVIAPLKNTPAYRAGILAGDKILSIDGVSTGQLNIGEAINMIRGERGTEVTLTILREGAEDSVDIDVRRDVIDVPVLETETVNGEIFVIRLYSFPLNVSDLFSQAMQEYRQSGLNKMILDLRGNPGGFLQVSVDVASWFLPSGKVIVEEDYNGNKKNIIHRSRGYGNWNPSHDLVVLIDEGSASASEIVAGSLSEHGVATLVGMDTFGKGSVQELVTISSETKLKITIAEWLTPEGRSFSADGLSPDFEVERTPEDILEGRDPQMDEAVRILSK